MEQMTISAVSTRFGISTRTLRYWEQVGLIESQRLPAYAYRVYTPETVRRIIQILVLRRLRVPLRDIEAALCAPGMQALLDALQRQIRALDRETDALRAVRETAAALANRISWAMQSPHTEMPDDAELLALAGRLAPLQNTDEGEKTRMNDLKRAEQILEESMAVRYIYLPPMTVAAAQYTGENPEDEAGLILDRFVEASGLSESLPGLRVFGFNNPSPAGEGVPYGYEFWVTIPEDMEVLAPLEKKRFAGGLYAAHAIRMGDFHEWRTFTEYMLKSKQYEIEWDREPSGMGGSMEEHLNAKTYYEKDGKSRAFTQLDLLLPIREKREKDE